jgi:ferredoxin
VPIVKFGTHSFKCDEGQNLYQLLIHKGVGVRSSCGGVGACGDCFIKVVSGEESLSEFNITEKHYLGNVYHLTKERLSCQVKVNGDCKISLE